ncbi:MAG: DUF1743 domain-containing protein [Candidatus Thorarchaeota archaeon]
MQQKPSIVLHIGFDDTDSLEGSCTTYIATELINRLYERVEFLDYPRLIRNNPNIPWKTRGNGAIALTLSVEEIFIEEVISIAINTIEELHQNNPDTNPGIAILKGKIPKEIHDFAFRALTEVISISEAKKYAEKYCYKYHFIGNGRGIIGGLAAVGNVLNPENEDFTFEILTYRTANYIGKKRSLNDESVRRMDKQLSPLVFNNIDEDSRKVIINPAGLDPVLYGIRGENPIILLKAKELVEVNEPIDSYCIFRTNQGTDQHFKFSKPIIRNFSVFKGEVEVMKKPETLIGGHIIFKGLILENNQIIDVAAFEPSKKFRNVIRKLIPGDKIVAYGGIRYKSEFQNFTLQLEKCDIFFLSKQFKEESPFCPKCEKRMTSNGFEKGYKCKKCGYKDRALQKLKIPVQREITLGTFIPPEQAQRHLIKPFRRYNIQREKTLEIIENWWKKRH